MIAPTMNIINLSTQTALPEYTIVTPTIFVRLLLGGRTSDVKAAVELAKKNGAKIICITHSYHSPISETGRLYYCSPAPETPLLGRNASARILQLTLLDAFFVSVAQLNIEQANINMQKPAQC